MFPGVVLICGLRTTVTVVLNPGYATTPRPFWRGVKAQGSQADQMSSLASTQSWATAAGSSPSISTGGSIDS